MALPPSRFDFLSDVPRSSDLGAVHFIAIGGAGMSGVARVLLGQGLVVSGSDAKGSPVLRALESEGARVHVGHDPAHVSGADTVVISSAIRDDNPELVAARAAGLPVLHRAQALAAAMADQQRVAVAGANGKTTTTSMLTVALQRCGLDPSFALGGELAKRATNAHVGCDDVFVVEADESDSSFLVYRPHVAVVTSIQPDHLDFYGSFATVEEAYRAFVRTMPDDGLLIVCVDDPGARRLADWARSEPVRVLTYGTSQDADLVVGAVEQSGMGAAGALTAGQARHRLTLEVPGVYNLLNASAAFAVAVYGLGQLAEDVLAGLASYSGTRRRFEVKGAARGVRVVDDYAHNPGKVSAVVGTGTALVAGTGRLVVVFQPHLYSRTRDFAAELGSGLAPADVVVVMDVYAAREDPLPGVSGRLVADAVRTARPACDVVFVPSWTAVAPLVAGLVRAGDLVLTVGAGDVTMVGPEVLRLVGADDPAASGAPPGSSHPEEPGEPAEPGEPHEPGEPEEGSS